MQTSPSLASLFFLSVCLQGEEKDNGGRRLFCFPALSEWTWQPCVHSTGAVAYTDNQDAFCSLYANTKKLLRNQFVLEVQLCQICMYCLWVQVETWLWNAGTATILLLQVGEKKSSRHRYMSQVCVSYWSWVCACVRVSVCVCVCTLILTSPFPAQCSTTGGPKMRLSFLYK